MIEGVVFDNLAPNDSAVVLVVAFDSLGDVRMEGRSEPFEIDFGSHIDLTVVLDQAGL